MASSWIFTADGSPTAFNTDVQEHYHNCRGAYTEAVETYLKPANLLERLSKNQELTLLDPFYGLGYNTWVVLQALLTQAMDRPWSVSVMAIEQDLDIALSTPRIFDAPGFTMGKDDLVALEHKIYYQTLNNQPETIVVGEQQHLTWQFFVADTLTILPELPDNAIDLIFHDAFSPNKQPELWTVDVFRHYRRLLRPEGAVFTYSCARSTINALTEAGFIVQKRQPENYNRPVLSAIIPAWP